MLPYRNQSNGFQSKSLIGFYMMATLAFNALTNIWEPKPTILLHHHCFCKHHKLTEFDRVGKMVVLSSLNTIILMILLPSRLLMVIITNPSNNPANIYLLKVNKRNTRKRCGICSKLTIKTPERHHWRRSAIFIVNFEHISQFFLVYLLLTLNK